MSRYGSGSSPTPVAAQPSLDDEAAAKMIQALLGAKNPVMYVGGGILLADAATEMRELAEHLFVAGRAYADGQGCAARRSPADPRDDWLLGDQVPQRGKTLERRLRSLRWAPASPRPTAARGKASTRRRAADAADPHQRRPGARSSHNYPVAIGAVARSHEALKVLIRVARKVAPKGVKRDKLLADRRPTGRASSPRNKKAMESSAWPMRPERILADLRTVMPRDALLCTDVGWNKNGMAQQYPIYTPGSVFTPGGFATMGFGSPAALGAKVAKPDRVVVALIGDGGFGQNPAALATAFEDDIAVIWVIMNNCAFGTIAGLEKAHYGTTFGTVFEKNGKPYSPDYAAIARAYGIDGVKINSAAEFKPALEKAVKSKRPVVIDVYMKNVPTPTAGHWNIMDIYSPGKKVHHVSTGD